MIQKKASLILCLLDDFSGQMVSGSNIRVLCGQHKAVRRDEGYYLLINLEGNQHKVRVQSDIYIDEEMEIDLAQYSNNLPMIYVRLKPNQLYPLSNHTTGIRGCCMQGILPAVRASIYTESLSTAPLIKISEDITEAGSSLIKLYFTGNSRLEGKEFIIHESEEADRERCTIANVEEDRFILEQALQFSHKRGTTLIPIHRSASDDKGHFLILFRQTKGDTSDILCTFEYRGSQLTKEWTLKNGEIKNVGILNFGEQLPLLNDKISVNSIVGEEKRPKARKTKSVAEVTK